MAEKVHTLHEVLPYECASELAAVICEGRCQVLSDQSSKLYMTSINEHDLLENWLRNFIVLSMPFAL
jgi:hypothetical protein